MHHRDVQSPSGTVRAGEEDISSLLTLSQLNFLFYGTVPAKRLGKLSLEVPKRHPPKGTLRIYLSFT